MHTPVNTHVEARTRYQISSPIALLLISFKQGLSLNQKHAALARLAGERAPSIFLLLSPTLELQVYAATPGFLHRCWRF